MSEKEEKTRSVYRDPASYGFLIAQVAILAAIAGIGFLVGSNDLSRSRAWLLILVLMAPLLSLQVAALRATGEAS